MQSFALKSNLKGHSTDFKHEVQFTHHDNFLILDSFCSVGQTKYLNITLSSGIL